MREGCKSLRNSDRVIKMVLVFKEEVVRVI